MWVIQDLFEPLKRRGNDMASAATSKLIKTGEACLSSKYHFHSSKIAPQRLITSVTAILQLLPDNYTIN